MNKPIKPIKPKKPSKNEHPPTKEITVGKILVYDTNNKKYLLIDNKSHPELYTDPTGILCDYPYWSQLEECGFEWSLENLKYSDYKEIFERLNRDFEINLGYNEDGYYEYTTIIYKDEDPDYDSKLEKYNNRFLEYELLLIEYDAKMKHYEEIKKNEKKKKLMEELNKL